MNTKGNGAVS